MASEAAASSNSPTWVRIGPAGRRRRVDHRQVADAGQRHLQGPGDGAGGQGEDVDPVGQGLDRLLVADPEPLLLVHHQQAQLLEGDVPAEEAVGPHHHVHRAVGQSGQHRLGLGVGQEPAEHLHLAPGRGVPVGEGLGVLAGQQGGRHQHRGLVPVLDRLEHGPDGHLGLAEARRRRRPAGPWAGAAPCPPSPPRWPGAGPRSRRRGTTTPARPATGCPARRRGRSPASRRR